MRKDWGIKMKIYSLSGPSGTGKSTSALQFAHKHQIEAIIDDGLLIVRGEKIAGTSAKFEKNVLTAVRRAIIEEEWHKQDIVNALQSVHIDSLLIIGTSDKMTKKIAKRLQLGEIDTYFYVQDIRSAKEIHMAKFVREIQGKHVMPVPYRQVEQNFFKRLVQKGKDIFTSNSEKLGEITIVRPDFQQQTITIARTVYIDLIKYIVESNDYVAKLMNVQFSITSVPRISVEVHLIAPVTYIVPTVVRELQQQLTEAFWQHLQLEPEQIDVIITEIESKQKTSQT